MSAQSKSGCLDSKYDLNSICTVDLSGSYSVFLDCI
nr:MAG TPA: hypothetical protein [Inoviridae sp.]